MQDLVAYPAACALLRFSSKHKIQMCNHNGIMHNMHLTQHQHVDAESSVPAALAYSALAQTGTA